MSLAKEPFFYCVGQTLLAALCVQAYPPGGADAGHVPEVEAVRPHHFGVDNPSCSTASALASSSSADSSLSSPLRANPLVLQWTQGDECCIEAAHDGTRVSFWFAAAHEPKDALTAQLLAQYIAFFGTHGAAAGLLPVLRCAAVARGSGCYDVSFLVLPGHVERYGREAIADFIVLFVKKVEADVAGLKVSLNAGRRAAAQAFFSHDELSL